MRPSQVFSVESAPGGSPLRPPPVLYGRDTETDALRRYLAAAHDGSGGLVLIGGEAGIGKTALVQATAQEARERGFLVLAGACYDLGSPPPYGPWADLLGAYPVAPNRPPLPEDLANPDLLGTLAGQDALFAQVAAFFAEVAAEIPLMLVLEDLHCADEASLDLLRSLARRFSTRPILIVATHRVVAPGASPAFERVMPQLVLEGGATRVSPLALARPALNRIVADRYALTDDDHSRLVDYLLRYAEGNPFFTDELLRTLEHDQLLTPSERGWSLRPLVAAQVPALVRQLIDGHLAWMDEPAQRLVRIASVIGSEVPLELWQTVAGANDDAIGAAIDQAMRARLLEESRDRGAFRFTHALVREAVYDGLVLPARQRWHRAIATELASRPDAAPGLVAHHFVQADDARAARWLIRSGHRAARRDATRDAIERYQHALRWLERDDATLAERGWLLADLAQVHRYTDPRHALTLLDAASQIAAGTGDDALAAIVAWGRARMRGYLGEPALDDLNEAVAGFEALSPEDRQRAAAGDGGAAIGRGLLAQWLAYHGRYDDALAIAATVLDPPPAEREPGSRDDEAYARFGVGLASAGLGRPAEARVAFADARRRFAAIRNDNVVAAATAWQLAEVAVGYHADTPEERTALTDQYLTAWIGTGRCTNGADGRPLLPLFRVLILDGRWAEARESLAAYRHVSHLRIHAILNAAELDRHQGHPARAWTALQTAMAGGPAGDPGTLNFVVTLALQRLAADLALDLGRPDEAKPWIEAHDRWLAWSGRIPDRAAGALLWSRYLLASGNPDRAFELATDALRLASIPRQPLALLAAHRALGALATLARRPEPAESHLAASLNLANACALPFERALSLVALAECRIANGHHEQAAPLLDEARGIVTALGAASTLAQIATIAAQPVVPAPPPDRSGLTEREHEVLRLLTVGRSNPEIADALYISRGTVRVHVSNILAKLDARSRTEAADIARRRGIV